MATILAIETSSEMASCALLRGERVYFRESSGVRTHSQSVRPMIQELLAEAGIVLRDCDAIAYGAGPGSFTGVRTACGNAQGLGFGAGQPLLPIVTLDAMALACRERHGSDEVLAVLDARMNEVYWAQYRFEGGQPVAVLPPALSAPSSVTPAGPARACGNGFAVYRKELETRYAGKLSQIDAGRHPHARDIARLAIARFQANEAMSAEHAVPVYVRNKVALRSDERATR